jgi:hypothetical protein
MSDDLIVIKASEIPPSPYAGDEKLPFCCFDCGRDPTHIAYSRKHHWVWACSRDTCVPSGYNVELARMKNEAEALDWSLHLMGTKVWFPETCFSWAMRLREIFGHLDA